MLKQTLSMWRLQESQTLHCHSIPAYLNVTLQENPRRKRLGYNAVLTSANTEVSVTQTDLHNLPVASHIKKTHLQFQLLAALSLMFLHFSLSKLKMSSRQTQSLQTRGESCAAAARYISRGRTNLKMIKGVRVDPSH